MIVIALILLLPPVVIIIGIIKTKGTIRKILITLLSIIVLIPICIILLIPYMQQGKIFPAAGKLALLLAQPEDIWEPLASATLDKNKREYQFIFSHKYVGNHDVEILLSEKAEVWKINKDQLEFTVSFYDGEKELFSKETSHVGGFNGLRGDGFTFIRYSLPEDLPIGQELNVKVTVNGDIEKFINRYGAGRIIINKGSDM